jgi:stearoyl-CoA desaturase (Delta-9 desaturase)
MEKPGLKRKTILIFFVVGPIIGTIYAIIRLWNDLIGWQELSLFLGLYLLTGLGITFGYHRLLTHRSFETVPAVKAIALILGSMAVQGSAVDWASNHLKHHAHSDEEGDPHSPVDGLFHAHIGWLFSAPAADRERYAKKLMADPMIVWIDRTFLLWVALGLAIPYAIAGVEGLLWGGFARIVLVNHVSWSVNSICHTFGSQPFNNKDQSRNLWIFGLLAFGEGWHHNHHAFPAMAFHGMSRRQVDLTAYLIRFLRRFGLVWNVKLPSPELIARRRKPVISAGE